MIDTNDYRALERLEPSRLCRVVYFYFDPAVPPSKSEAVRSLPPRLFFEDTGVWDIAIRLKALIEGAGAVDRLYCESLGIVLAHKLVSFGPGGLVPRRRFAAGSPGGSNASLRAISKKHLADEIPLATIAQLARLSPYHLSRAFKQTFGMPPHRLHTPSYRTGQITAEASHGLGSVSVATAMEFSAASSFSTAFRKATDMTQQSFREALNFCQRGA